MNKKDPLHPEEEQDILHRQVERAIRLLIPHLLVWLPASMNRSLSFMPLSI
jgi:hypothetical protein